MRVAVLPDQQRRGRDLGMPELTLLLLSQPVVGFNLRARASSLLMVFSLVVFMLQSAPLFLFRPTTF